MNQTSKRSGAVLTVDLGAIRDNYRMLRTKAAGAVCSAVLKADAYGLGAARVASVLAAEGCRHFFVAHLDEAISLRPHVPNRADIFVLHGPLPGTEHEFVDHRLIPVLNSLPQIYGWRQLAQKLNRNLPAVVQFDSGMSRMGLAIDELDALSSDADALRGIDLRYVMSHLACAESQHHPMNAIQLQNFNAGRKRLPACGASLANSSGIFLGSEFHYDLVRPGAALYGIAPVVGAANPMRPVVRLQGRIIQTRTIQLGDRVGYGLTYRAANRRCIATVSVGYADGWLRSLANRGTALIAGTPVPLVGAVSMDTITVDVTGIGPAHILPGACVDLISATQTVDVVAAQAGTIGYEILTNLGSRYHRLYADSAVTEAAAGSEPASMLARFNNEEVMS
jgi:alanine racemase